jgi:hypothetical protein
LHVAHIGAAKVALAAARKAKEPGGVEDAEAKLRTAKRAAEGRK